MITFSRLGNYGRLGNQLFQIASTIGIANHNETQYTFPEWKYQKHFVNPLPSFPIMVGDVYTELSPYYQEVILNSSRNWDLQGYFQSWKYFANVRDEIKHYFYFDRTQINKVAIHVRRGDYLRFQYIHPVMPLSYYQQAMTYFSPDTQYTVFSDDINWCKENFIGDQYEFSIGNTAIDDFTFMSEHKAFIIANSSYSWWAAYLAPNNPTVVSPLNYVVGEDKTDRLLPEWIKI